jgi:hypothetical protein
MKSRNLAARFLLLSSLCVVSETVACSNQETPAQPSPSAATSQPAAAPASAPVAAAPAAAPMSSGTAIASAQYSNDPNLRCDLLEVKRVSGGALLVRWRLINTAGAQASAGLVASGGQSKPINYDFDWKEIYYTDPVENKKYAFLTDSDNNRILDVFYGNYEAGQQRLNWAKFPAPPPTSNKITVFIPKFMPFEDVSVSQ